MESLVSLVSRTFNIPKSHVTPDLAYRAIPQWDSLGHVELMSALEAEYGIRINNNQVLKLDSIATIQAFIETYQAPQAQLSEDAAPPLPINGDKINLPKKQIARGLKRIFFDQTRITYIDVMGRDLIFRGYSIHQLAELSSFEETAFLVLYGKLPTRDELNQFDEKLKSARQMPPGLIELLTKLTSMHPLHALRTAISALPAFEPPAQESANILGIRLIARIPTIIAAHQRLRYAQTIVPPRIDLAHSANFLYMLTGQAPTPLSAKLMDKDLLLHVDHSSTPSTFVARVTAGTKADIYAAVTSALAALGGDLHGNAPENIIRQLHEIGTPDRAAEYVAEKRSRDEPIMGFGHRIYRTEDPRARHFRKSAQEISNSLQQQHFIALAEALVLAMQPYSRHGIDINDDYYSSITLHLLGIPTDLFGSVAAASRIVGLVAHVAEQYSNNIMMAPSLEYIGSSMRTYVPIEQRI
ncbi:MAG: citrate (Si)-synthase [Oligoflexia bacterium]|nr:citrate (Si)-synthase [Oligoflexia bacterium]